MYYKYPTETFVKSVRIENEIANNDEEAHNVSPRCQTLRMQANANMQKKANSITEKIMKILPSLVFKVGDVVLVPLDAVDCTKVDGGSLAGVVVSINKAKSTCRVAVQHGLLHHAYVYHVLKPVPESSNNLDVLNLREAYEDWRSLTKITEREAARFISSVGGQTAGEAAPQTVVLAGKRVGYYEPPVATGTASYAKKHIPINHLLKCSLVVT